MVLKETVFIGIQTVLSFSGLLQIEKNYIKIKKELKIKKGKQRKNV
ncbi:hypothetical protein SAMN04487922_1348 [Bacillus toyonensis]|nr:hypothetical protein SAMN04487922_1348 [Bacillus toyonensis]